MATGHNVTLTFSAKNCGKRAGKEITQVYATLPNAGEPPKRLIAWQKVDLAAVKARPST